MTSKGGSVISRGPIAADQRKRLETAARQHGKAVVVAPVYDTIKRVENSLVAETLDRDKLREPLAWACTSGSEPPSDPPPAEWFLGAMVVE